MLELALHLSTAATKPAWRLTPLHYFFSIYLRSCLLPRLLRRKRLPCAVKSWIRVEP